MGEVEVTWSYERGVLILIDPGIIGVAVEVEERGLFIVFVE